MSTRGYLDDRIFQRKLKKYVKESGKSGPVACNKAARSACMRAIRKTPKTRLARITADVGTPGNPSPGGYAAYEKTHPGVARLPGFKDKVVRMIKAKRSSVAYIAAGFFKALRVFASTTKDVTPQSIAARGRGKKARPDSKFSEILNTAPGADEMAAGPLAAASVEALDDMIDYMHKSQQGAARRFN